jgi:glycosyltransferase involved in cell wall biosynthesis
MKKTILHFIYDLGRGGAETMLVRVLKELKEYNNIVVTLYDNNRFENELDCEKYICLNQQSLFLFPLTAIRLRKLIEKEKVDLVHTHLFWPTLIGRLGTPGKIPLVTTIHAFIARSVEYRSRVIRSLDKISYRVRSSIIVGVAAGATKEYFSFLKLQPFRAYTLYTFVDIDQFNLQHSIGKIGHEGFRIISIGALRLQKNHQYLVETFKLLKEENIELHIYGEGPLLQPLQEAIDRAGVKIKLKGLVRNMNEILAQYDLFVMASTYEGFSLSVLEGMAMKVPMLLSEIESFREQCDHTAMFFRLDDPNDLAMKIRLLAGNSQLRSKLSENAYSRVLHNFTLPQHMEQLREIYIENLNNS